MPLPSLTWPRKCGPFLARLTAVPVAQQLLLQPCRGQCCSPSASSAAVQRRQHSFSPPSPLALTQGRRRAQRRGKEGKKEERWPLRPCSAPLQARSQAAGQSKGRTSNLPCHSSQAFFFHTPAVEPQPVAPREARLDFCPLPPPLPLPPFGRSRLQSPRLPPLFFALPSSPAPATGRRGANSELPSTRSPFLRFHGPSTASLTPADRCPPALLHHVGVIWQVVDVLLPHRALSLSFRLSPCLRSALFPTTSRAAVLPAPPRGGLPHDHSTSLFFSSHPEPRTLTPPDSRRIRHIRHRLEGRPRYPKKKKFSLLTPPVPRFFFLLLTGLMLFYTRSSLGRRSDRGFPTHQRQWVREKNAQSSGEVFFWWALDVF